jgi:phage gp36-like protein
VSYATIQDANDMYGEDYVLTSVDRDSDGEPDTTALTKALSKASSEIDSYLGVRYNVPLTTVPEIIKGYTIDIAIYKCSSGPAAGLTEEKRQRYDDAIKWLINLSKGVTSLGLEETDADTEHRPVIEAETRLFTRSKLRGLL